MEEFFTYLWFVLAFVVAGLLLLALLPKLYKPKLPTSPYVKTPLLTASELRFFSLLESVLPDYC
jgi:hypothetical protein